MLVYAILMTGYCTISGLPSTKHHVTALTTEQQQPITSAALDVNDDWSAKVDERSINYFRSRLQIAAPNFIRFRVVFGEDCTNNSYPGYTNEMFNPYQWVWTYQSSRGLYPYLHWNLDYSILSFGLLDTKTLWEDPFILFNVKGNCSNITLGTDITTHRLAEQLMVLVSRLSGDNKTITEYQQSYFCYLAEAPGFRNSVWYHMALYLDYPISIINYKCCTTLYNYTQSKYDYSCEPKPIGKWMVCTSGPYLLGFILFLYFPILLFNFSAWLAKRNNAKHGEPIELDENTPLIDSKPEPQNDRRIDDDWVFLDGNAPKSFADLFAAFFPDNHPVIMSRLKRLLFVLLGPTIVFIQLWFYSIKDLEITQKVIARGVPVGFLALLGTNSTIRRNAFVPALGGPVVLLASYFVLGILFLVIPRSVQSVIEYGIPKQGSSISPLCLTAKDIRHISQISTTDKPGYKNAANLFLCSFYMLFTADFWKKVFHIQKARLLDSFCLQSGVCKCICMLLLPLYVLACFIEIVVCIIYFAIPICPFIVVISRGAVKTIASTVRQSRLSTERNMISLLIKNKLVIGIFSFVVAAMFIFYVYTFCLVFIESFFFISQLLIFCYIAVLVYPAVAFGYLFFGVVLLYYIFRLIRGFGAKYLDLLNEIVEVCMQIEEQDNYTHVYDGNLIISNAKITRLRSIKINEVNVPVAQNTLQGFQEREKKHSLLRFKNNTYGIRNELFNYAVRKHLPVHQQVLRVVFHLALIITFLLITISLTAGFVTGPTSEISDMMHVVFVITVGALPRILEVAMLDSSEHIHREIRLRNLHDTINEYLQEITRENNDLEPPHYSIQEHQELPHTSSYP